MNSILRRPIQAEQDPQLTIHFPSCIPLSDGDAVTNGETSSNSAVSRMLPMSAASELSRLHLLDLRKAVAPEYHSAAARLQSFVGWPQRGVPRPRQLVPAGFLYTGAGDSVRCFYCGVTLKNWREDDDVWETHVRFRFSCDYITAIKGENFVIQTQIKLGRPGSGDGQGTGEGNRRGENVLSTGLYGSNTSAPSLIASGATSSIDSTSTASSSSSEAPISTTLATASGNNSVARMATASTSNRTTSAAVNNINKNASSEATTNSSRNMSERGNLAGPVSLPENPRCIARSTVSARNGSSPASSPFSATSTGSCAESQTCSVQLPFASGAGPFVMTTEDPSVQGRAALNRNRAESSCKHAAGAAVTTVSHVEVGVNGVPQTRQVTSVYHSGHDIITSSAAEPFEFMTPLLPFKVQTDGDQGRRLPGAITTSPPHDRTNLLGSESGGRQAPTHQTRRQSPPASLHESDSGENRNTSTEGRDHLAHSPAQRDNVPSSDDGETSPAPATFLAEQNHTSTPSSTVMTEVPTTTATRRRSRRPQSSNESDEVYFQQLQETNRRLRQLRRCRLCGQNPVDTIFLPCGHLCTCESCAATIRDCCLCRDRIKGTAHVYLE